MLSLITQKNKLRTKESGRQLRILLLTLLSTFLINTQANAFTEGDACTEAGATVRAGDATKGLTLICNGSNYVLVQEHDLSGNITFNKGIKVGVDNALTCNATNEGVLRFDNAEKSIKWLGQTLP